MNKNAIKDALYNLSLSENNNQNANKESLAYYRGLIVGIVASYCYQGARFDDALRLTLSDVPKDCIDLEKILPDGWIERIN